MNKQTLNELLGNLVIEDELADQYRAEIQRELNVESNYNLPKNTELPKSQFTWTATVHDNKTVYGFHCSVSGGKGAIAVITGEGTPDQQAFVVKMECVIDNAPLACDSRTSLANAMELDTCEATELVIETIKQRCFHYIGFFAEEVKSRRD
jgi:hypothetical protein